MPGGRPAQPAAPALGSSVQLARVAPTGQRRVRAAHGVRLTDRAWGLILACIAAVVVTGGFVVVTQFLGVSNAPVVEQGTFDQAAHAVVQG